jgi:8-oxo-dGTP pyrophosphatase MutT (NUDIX family)
MPNKSRLFIASSTEHVRVAYAIQENLDSDAEVTVWDQNASDLNSYVLEKLMKVLDENEFFICVCAPSDQSEIRGQRVDVARDNVLFELGLFIGRHGRERCFMVQPSGVDLHLPSDIAGIITGRYDANRSDGSLRAALGPACNQIREQVKKLTSKDVVAKAEKTKVKELAVFCYRNSGPNLELLLTRTSSGGRWTLPKGRRFKQETIGEAVLRLSHEKAGAVGKVDTTPIGTFRHLRTENNQEQILTTFLLEVERLDDPPQRFRKPTWFDTDKAVAALAEDRGYQYAQEFRGLAERAVARVAESTPRATGSRL